MYCPECGSWIEPGSEFCTNCGNKISTSQSGIVTKPDMPRTVPPPNTLSSSDGETVSQIRPWVRFFARFIDVGWSYLVALGVFIVLGMFIALIAPNTNISDIPAIVDILITTMMTFLILALIEPFFIANYGQTPGKWLFKTRVTKGDGSLLTFSEAWNRSFSVYIRGYLLGLPFVNWITLFIESSKLEKEGKTTWDQKGGFVVRHEKIGIPRVIAAFIIIVLIRFFMSSMLPK
jgi:uncharacterized RDD family membrane protein YckC